MTELFGLVVIGGKSTRMGEDKSLLIYHGIPQRYYLYEMLQTFCDKVFISCNLDQAKNIFDNFNLVIDSDKYENTGPMAALLSAFDKHPGKAFLITGCDYPFLKKDDLKKLIDERNENTIAISYFNQEASIQEPLLAIYEPGSFPLLKRNFEDKKYSLRHFLQETNAMKIVPSNPDAILSIDTTEQYKRIVAK